MSTRKIIIKEQKIKDVVEVLVIHTCPAFWELTCKKQPDKTHIAVNDNKTRNARYIAFLLTHRRDESGRKIESAITHIAKVKETKHVQRKITYEGFPKLIEYERKRGRDLEGTHKHYVLGKLIEVEQEIPKKKGEQKGQNYFYTTMSELRRTKSVGEIRTLKQLKKMDRKG